MKKNIIYVKPEVRDVRLELETSCMVVTISRLDVDQHVSNPGDVVTGAGDSDPYTIDMDEWIVLP